MGAPIIFSSEDFLQKNPKPNRKKHTAKGINTSSQNPDSSVSVVKHPGVNLVMGQVKILKRGEKLCPKKNDEGCEFDFDLGSTNRIGPDPETMQKQVRVWSLTGEVYAGPTSSVASPLPCSLPIPRFLEDD